MARTRKYFFLDYTAIDGSPELIKGLVVESDGIRYVILKIHPRKGGVTVTKVG